MRQTPDAWVGLAVDRTGLVGGAPRTEGWIHTEALELDERLISQAYKRARKEMDAYCY